MLDVSPIMMSGLRHSRSHSPTAWKSMASLILVACLFMMSNAVHASTFEDESEREELPSSSSWSPSSSSSIQSNNVDDAMYSVLHSNHHAEARAGTGNGDECSWGRNAHDNCAACHLVVAASTIEGAGLGVFTLVDLGAEDPIGGRGNPGDMVIPIPKLPFTPRDRFQDYTWAGDLYGGNQNAFSPGIQSLSNSHTGLLNIHLHEAATHVLNQHVESTSRLGGTITTSHLDDPPLIDATPYHHVQSRVYSKTVNDIAAGSELFTVYGDNWFEKRASRFQNMPKSSDFQLADNLVRAFQTQLVDRIRVADVSGNRRRQLGRVSGRSGHSGEYGSDALFRADSSRLRKSQTNNEDEVFTSGSPGDDGFGYQYDDSWQMDAWTVVGDIIGIWGSNSHDTGDGPKPQNQMKQRQQPRLASFERVLPRPQDLQQTFQLGLRSLYQLQATRTVTELRQDPTVRCLDGIVPGKSKVIATQSGAFGAVATRHFANGTVITGSPLLPTLLHHWNSKTYVWDSETKSYVFLHDFDATVPPNKRLSFPPQQYSLLINYCFGHINSTLLLCPYGVGVSYINHARKPNVAIRWAPDGHLLHNSEYLHMTPDELLERSKTSSLSPSPTGLAIDYVALRDIKEGEELTINYGRPWAKAYRTYLKIRQNEQETQQELLRERKRERLDASSPSISNAAKYNMERPILLTEAEQIENPYPYDMQLRCHPNIMMSQVPLTLGVDIWDDLEMNDGETDAREEQTAVNTPTTSKSSKHGFECHVLERTDTTTAFNPSETSSPQQKQKIVYVARVWYGGNWVGRSGIPRVYFKWFPKEQPHLFRFPMQLPDHMMPRTWMDSTDGLSGFA